MQIKRNIYYSILIFLIGTGIFACTKNSSYTTSGKLKSVSILKINSTSVSFRNDFFYDELNRVTKIVYFLVDNQGNNSSQQGIDSIYYFNSDDIPDSIFYTSILPGFNKGLKLNYDNLSRLILPDITYTQNLAIRQNLQGNPSRNDTFVYDVQNRIVAFKLNFNPNICITSPVCIQSTYYTYGNGISPFSNMNFFKYLHLLRGDNFIELGISNRIDKEESNGVPGGDAVIETSSTIDDVNGYPIQIIKRISNPQNPPMDYKKILYTYY